MHILALDIATKTGWARWNPTAARPVFGVFVGTGSLGEKVEAFRDFILSKITGEKITSLVVEACVPVIGPTSLDVLLHAHGLFAAAEGMAHRHALDFRAVNVGTWRSHFIGTSQAPKTKPDGSKASPAWRRKWLKDRTIAKCRERGWIVESDDAADALGLLDYERSMKDQSYGLRNTLFDKEAA